MTNWETIFSLARSYPSPHNSQPIRVRVINETVAELFFDKADGLPAEAYGEAFGFVTVGVFVELCSIVAHSLGYSLQTDLKLDTAMDFSTLNLHALGTLTLIPTTNQISDFSPELIEKRQTSRLPYEARTVSKEILAKLEEEAQAFGHTWHSTTEQSVVNQVIAVNQKTLFYDLEIPKVRTEIAHWLRYNKQHAAATQDGLSAECLEVNGTLLNLFINLHWLWRLPIFGTVAQRAYLATMQGVRQIGWITGPFKTNTDHYQSGRLLIRLWLHVTKAGVAIHPFGSVITNPRAHKEFCTIVAEHEENGMAWMLMRIGYSATPPKSYRRTIDKLVLTAPNE